MNLRPRKTDGGSVARTLAIKPPYVKFKPPSSLSTKTPATKSILRKKTNLLTTKTPTTTVKAAKSPTQIVFVDTGDDETDADTVLDTDKEDEYSYDEYDLSYAPSPPLSNTTTSMSVARKRQSTAYDLNDTRDFNTKMIKLSSLYDKNLLSLNFYEIFNINPDDANFNFMLNNAYELLEKTYFSINTRPEDAVNNSQTIMDTITFAYSVLVDGDSRRMYDDFLKIKDSRLFRTIREQIQNFDEQFESFAYETLKPLRSQIERLIDNDIVHLSLQQYFIKKQNAVVKLRPAALNRILITWFSHPRNANNENVTTETLQNYFKTYGTINGIVLCRQKKNCALLEYASSASVTQALADKNGIYKVVPLNKWTLNAETLSKLKSILDRITSLENRLMHYKTIDTMII
ncbi:Djbp [Euproctis pseudoconspersa nucleopolyhedrovirus]|uniref:Djbp n=1 Tax=Euproctis pseudoconspersa nucleopolyhedrovirus TaxID=307467 RepID=C3TWV1_9ABAC|nr:Djbp [Euproctis pseudoconspersa nucleopolyhedrovirus]ACO53493.1 Djbp [Euproctis pseudoconspersa nucleopolyhedrovirus]QUJ09232.1 Djbp protein [Gynaephora ruoergensis nucleopolyhedrovirus]